MTTKIFQSLDMENHSITDVNTVSCVTATCSGDMYCDDIHVQDGVFCDRVQADGDTSEFDTIIPNQNTTWDLGSSYAHWNDIYLVRAIFDSSSNNHITDTSTDLVLQGNSGMQLKLNSSGGIIVDGASVFRPSDNAGTDLGGSSFRWEDAYFQTVHEGDVVYEEKECEVCKKPFKKGDKICLVVLSVKEEGTRCVPAHVNCPG